MMEDVSERFKISSINDHAKTKGMWAGSLTPISIPNLQGLSTMDGKLKVVSVDNPKTPALLTIFNEVISNAIDHFKGNTKSIPSLRVTRIDITFDCKTGRFSVWNNGPGIPVVLHSEATAKAGHDVYIPEVIFSYFLTGSNIKKELTNVKGGINGLGAKLAFVHSVEATIETCDTKNNKFYIQKWKNRLDVRFNPQVINILDKKCKLTTEHKLSHTKVTFTPAYAELGCSHEDVELDYWIHLRAHQCAACVGPSVSVSYNGVICTSTSVELLGILMLTACDDTATNAIILNTQMKSTNIPYSLNNWDVSVVLLPQGTKKSLVHNMSIINGVVTPRGSHIQYVKSILSAAVEDKIRKAKKEKKQEKRKMSVAETLTNVRLIICGSLPGAEWSGQRKDELQVSKSILENYTMPVAFLKQASATIAESILTSVTKKPKFVHDKYTPSLYAGKSGKKEHAMLFATEGDSATTMLRSGLTISNTPSTQGGPSLAWCGIISLQGVIVNAAREVKEVEMIGGDAINVRSAKLQNNKRLLALADAFGLDYSKTYKTPQELATLNYGRLVLCVDQDLDGTGKIAALVLVWINLFWPALISSGRVGRFMTPLIRAYLRSNRNQEPVEFYYEAEFNLWLSLDTTRSKKYYIQYYKGLATHSENEVKRMFTKEAFSASMYTYTEDDTAKRLFEVYFGLDAKLRKHALASPVLHLTYEESSQLKQLKQIPVGRVQLDIDTKSYKHGALKRQLPGGIDGLNQARRKAIMGALLRLKGESASKGLKIFQLSGFVADKCFYHHGDTSLNSTLVYLAQSYPGARKYPYLIGVGQFGSRHGDKAGSARYISVLLSPLVNVVFSPEDRCLLTNVIEDGASAEPETYIPSVPMTALESYRIVSEAYNHDSYGRDLKSVLAVVKAYINGDPELTSIADLLHAEGPTPAVMEELNRLSLIWVLPVDQTGWYGEIRSYRNETYSFGMYTWEEETRTVVITELPMGVTTNKYLETISKPGCNGTNPRDEYIERIINQSSSDRVKLIITLRVDAFEKISQKFGDTSIDPIEDMLKLRASLKPHLNYYGINNAVLEFGDCYLATILYWAPVRRNLYLARITRAQIITAMRIKEESEILRYIEINQKLDITKKDDEASASAILIEHKFPIINSVLLHSPGYTTNAELPIALISAPGASYNYIFDLRERDLVRSAALKRTQKVEALKQELAIITAQLNENPVGASVWLQEIEEFVNVVNRGINTRWKF